MAAQKLVLLRYTQRRFRVPLFTSREPRCGPDRCRDATRSEGNGRVLGEVRNKVAARSGRNPNGPWPVARLAVLDTLAVSRYCLCVSALPVVQPPYGAATTGN